MIRPLKHAIFLNPNVTDIHTLSTDLNVLINKIMLYITDTTKLFSGFRALKLSD